MSDGDVDLRAVFETLDPKARDKLRRVLVNDLIDFLVLHKEERREALRLLGEIHRAELGGRARQGTWE